VLSKRAPSSTAAPSSPAMSFLAWGRAASIRTVTHSSARS
jgi:hypothetical protein